MKNNRATVTAKGQITLPIEIRRQMGLRDGDLVEFRLEQGTGSFKRYMPSKNRFERWAGLIGNLETLEEVITWQRTTRGAS